MHLSEFNQYFLRKQLYTEYSVALAVENADKRKTLKIYFIFFNFFCTQDVFCVVGYGRALAVTGVFMQPFGNPLKRFFCNRRPCLFLQCQN